ncbi:MAG TPA: hypothetical protein VGM19_00825 [Armatimonadota bacterium]|jgi:hypothetical protein
MTLSSPLRGASVLVALCLLGSAVLLAAGPICAQGFLVKPMSMDLTLRPGESFSKDIQITSTTDTPSVLKTKLLLVTQASNGAWVQLDPTSPQVDRTQYRTCVDWITIGSPELKMGPLEAKALPLTIKVPPGGVRGSYLAMLSLESAPQTRPGGNIYTVIEFLISLRITIQGPVARERVSLTDLDLQWVAAKDKNPATTQVGVQIKNEGDTFGETGGRLTLLRKDGERWQRVLETKLTERGVMPGATIKVTEDLKRSLPSGHYRVNAAFQLSGRPKGVLEKEFDLVGDPAATGVATDVALTVPELITVEGNAGATRTVALAVKNSTEESVDAACLVEPVAQLMGVALGDITGDCFDCSGWVKASPPRLTLRGNSARNLALSVAFPALDLPQANYYATLRFVAAHPDGQTAGETRTLIWVKNLKVESVLQAQPVRMVFAQQEGNLYAVTAQFANVGNVHFVAPTAQASVVSPTGEAAAAVPLETDATTVLPLGTPQFSGVMDFSKVAPGSYFLVAVMKYGSKDVSYRLPIKVEAGPDGGKLVTALEVTATPAPATAPPGGSANAGS